MDDKAKRNVMLTVMVAALGYFVDIYDLILVAEWNLPPVRFENVGTQSLYLGSIRSALFAGVLHTDMDLATERTVGNAGAQFDFNFTLAHRLPMTLSVGYAAGIEDGAKLDEEWLISLKIM